MILDCVLCIMYIVYMYNHAWMTLKQKKQKTQKSGNKFKFCYKGGGGMTLSIKMYYNCLNISLQELLSRAVNVNAQHDINGWTALHWAAKRNHLNIVNLLCNHG